MRSFDLIIFPHVWVVLCFHRSQTAGRRIAENKTSWDQNLRGVTASICPAISSWPSSGKFFCVCPRWTISRGKPTSCSPTAGQVLQLSSASRHFHILTAFPFRGNQAAAGPLWLQGPWESTARVSGTAEKDEMARFYHSFSVNYMEYPLQCA